jgi:outer membrane lipoprotein-sorting protein
MQTKKRIVIAVLSMLVTVAANAQSARSILDNASKAYNNAGGIIASFTANTEEVKAKTTYSQDGKAWLKANKFKIDALDGITWFDGTTQWVYVKDSEEVNVSTPSGEELAAVSPSVLLNIYKSGFKLNYKGEKKENGKTVYSVEMVPESKKSEYTRMLINIDKATNLISSISLFGKNGINNYLIIKSLKTNANLPGNTFVFNKNEYPKAEIIDLR